MYFQELNQDYKEMGAALLAVAFVLLHLVRTFMGSWQLHVFKQWAISSIESMESLRYETWLAEATLILKKSTEVKVMMEKSTQGRRILKNIGE